MPKIKKIRELKSKIKEVTEKESELEEDIEEAEAVERHHAESEFASVSTFKAPSLVLESDVSSAQTTNQTTQIQQESRERRQLEEQNVAYANTQTETTDTQRRQYASLQSQGTAAPTLQRRRINNQSSQVQPGQQFTQGVDTDRRIQRQEERQDYQAKTKKKHYPWEI